MLHLRQSSLDQGILQRNGKQSQMSYRALEDFWQNHSFCIEGLYRCKDIKSTANLAKKGEKFVAHSTRIV